MAKTNWQDPQSTEIISPHISGLQEAAGKIEESIGLPTISETGMVLSEVFISNDDRYRIFQAPQGKRNWVASPTPIIKKNGTIINSDFIIDFGGGAVIFTNPIAGSDILTADATYTVKIVGKGLSEEDFTTENKETLNYVHDNIQITKSPIGFPNREDSIFSFNQSTREFTIEPTNANYDVYFKDKKYTKSSAETIIIPLLTGLHFIFFDQYGTLTTSQAFPGLQNMIYISYIYCNADTGQYFCMGDERHGTVMDKATHERLHSVDWTQWVNGLQAYDYELNNPNGDNAVKLSINNGIVADEDLNHYISNSPAPLAFFEQFLQSFAKLPVMHRSGENGAWNQDTASEFPFKNTASGRVNFNEYDGTTWKQTEALNGAFVAYYVIFAGDVKEPIKVIQGQRYDSTLEEAQANNDDRNILWGNQPFQEFKVLYRLIYQTSNSYVNSRKSQLVDVLDLRAAKRSPGGGGIIPSAHSNLTGLDYASSGHTGFASQEQIENLDTKTKILYARFYNGPQSGLDNIALNVFGITTTNNLIFKITVNESAPPYLFAGSAYEVEEYTYTNLYKAQTAISYGGNKKFRKCVNGAWTAWEEIPTTEEGVWTPELRFGGNSVGIAYSQRSGRYRRIGKFVYWEAQFSLTSKGTSVGQASIGGLPFAASGDRYIPINRLRINFPSGGIDLKLWLAHNSASLVFYSSSASGGASDLTVTDVEFLNNSSFYACGTYTIN